MIKLLAKIFIKNHNDYQNEKVRSQYGILCGAFGIFLNAVLFTLKFVFGTLAASVAMVADAFQQPDRWCLVVYSGKRHPLCYHRHHRPPLLPP